MYDEICPIQTNIETQFESNLLKIMTHYRCDRNGGGRFPMKEWLDDMQQMSLVNILLGNVSS